MSMAKWVIPEGSVARCSRCDELKAKLAKAVARLEWVRTQEETPPFISMIVADTLKEEAELREARMQSLADLGQAQMAREAQLEAEAKLAKAVEALKHAEKYGDVETSAWAYDTLAELKGTDT